MIHRLTTLLSAALFTSATLCQAQIRTRTWQAPASIYTIYDGTELTRAELSDTATLLSFRRTTPWFNDTLRVHSTTYIIDEQGKRHYTLASYGIPTDQYVRWGNRSEWCYTLKFAPLPPQTKSFDVMAGPYDGNAQWYGVHEASTELRIPTPKISVSQKQLHEELMKKGTATVRGHVTNGKDYPVWPVWVLRTWDDLDANSFNRKGKAVLIHENGDFEFSVDLQRPVFACLYLGYYTQLKPILLYLEPGKTVTLDVRDVYGHGAYVGYSSNQRFRKLLECYPTRLLSRISLDEAGDYERVENLTNYLIHKYDLSKMEGYLLHGFNELKDQYIDLGIRSYNIYGEDSAATYSIEDVEKNMKNFTVALNKDERSWLFSPFFADFGGLVAFDANYDNGMHCQTVDEMKEFTIGVDSVLLQAFEAPRSTFLLQEISFQYLSSWLTNLYPLSGADREEAIAYLENHYTDPYVRGRVRGGLEDIDSIDYCEKTIPVEPGSESAKLLERIYAPFKGKFLQIITLRNGDNKHVLPTIGNLLTKYADSPDVAFLFVSHGNEIADEDCVNRILNYFPYQTYSQGHQFLKHGYLHLSDEDFNQLNVVFNCLTGDFDYVTLNREGQPLQRPLSLRSEIDFTFALNQQVCGIYGDLPVEEATARRNGIEVLESQWNTLDALQYTLSSGRNIRPDIFVADYGSPLNQNSDDREGHFYVYLTKQEKSQPLEFELTKHLQLPSNGTYRIDMLYTIDGDSLSGTLGGKPFTLNSAECNDALKELTHDHACEIPVLAAKGNGSQSKWNEFMRLTNYWGWNYAHFTVHQDNGAGTLDCTFRQSAADVLRLGDKAINWLCIIDLRITKIE